MKFSRRHTLKAIDAKKERPSSQFIPYDGHITNDVVITSDGNLLMCIKLQGYSFETADDEDVDMKKAVRNTLLKSVASQEYSMWFHTVRHRTSVSIEGEFNDTFPRFVNDEWKDKHKGDDSFVNDLYITIYQTTAGANAVQGLYKTLDKAMTSTDKEAQDQDLLKNVKKIRDLVYRLIGSLKDYKPQILGVYQTESGTFSEILEFLSLILNAGYSAPMLVPATNAATKMARCRLYFGRNAMEIRGPCGKSKYGGILCFKDYPTYTSAGMLDNFLRLPFEFIMGNVYQFANRSKAVSEVSNQQRRMSSTGDKAISQMEELTLAMDMATSGQIAFGDHSIVMLVLADDLEELERNASQCYGELVNVGIVPVREQMNLQPAYWALLPGNAGYLSRKARVHTLNIAGLASLHNYPTGKKDNNHWGKALTVLDTTSGTPYYFNFHVRDVGHSMIIGPTGAGKTVMMNFLMAQAMKYDCRMFFFDKDRGAEIFIRALGGQYSIIDPSGDSSFNPLLLEDTHENRTFLSEWVRSMALATSDNKITPEENDMIAHAVAGNYKLPFEERMLRNVVPFMGLEEPGSIARRLRIWHSGETHSGLFDNKKDSVDFSVSRVFGFEMAKVLADGLSLSPTLLYLFHKINLSLDGTPTVIVLDEAWALIDNPVFAPKIKDWLKVLRKLNAMVMFATQSVEDIANSNISDTLVQQTATQIYLPNNKATSVYQDVFMLSNREFQLIKTTDPGTRYFLVKQNNDSVVARIDLSGMDDVINVLSGRADTVRLLDKIREEVGNRPEDWLPVFYERVKKLEDD